MSNAGLIWGVLVFYSVLFLILGSLGISSSIGNVVPPTLPANPSAHNYIDYGWSGIGFFFSALTFSVAGLPGWMTLIIFTPLTLMILWVLIELIISVVSAVLP
ncbi:MAG: hypothetical protein WC389_22365 [Lutibacter sp.]|jgi:hypothetical protein